MSLPRLQPKVGLTWEEMSDSVKSRRVAGLLRVNQAKHERRLERLAKAKSCACGCGGWPKNGRTWLTGHNAMAGQLRTYTKESRAAFRASGKRSSKIRRRIGRAKGSTFTEEQKQTVSIGVRQAIADGRLNPGANIRKAYATAELEGRFLGERGGDKHRGHSGYFHSIRMRKDFYYASSWELARLKALEASPNVVSYTRTPVRIRYGFAGKAHWYFPDFGIKLVDGTYIIEEIKPRRLFLTKAINQMKWFVLKQFCASRNYVARVITSLKKCEENI